MASSQGTSISSNSVSRLASHDIFLFKYHFLLQILRFLFFFSDNIMTDVASKQQTTALFLSLVVTRTRRQTELTKKKLKNLMGNLRCTREHSVQIFVQFFTQLNCTFNLVCIGPFRQCYTGVYTFPNPWLIAGCEHKYKALLDIQQMFRSFRFYVKEIFSRSNIESFR